MHSCTYTYIYILLPKICGNYSVVVSHTALRLLHRPLDPSFTLQASYLQHEIYICKGELNAQQVQTYLTKHLNIMIKYA